MLDFFKHLHSDEVGLQQHAGLAKHHSIATDKYINKLLYFIYQTKARPCNQKALIRSGRFEKWIHVVGAERRQSEASPAATPQNVSPSIEDGTTPTPCEKTTSLIIRNNHTPYFHSSA